MKNESNTAAGYRFKEARAYRSSYVFTLRHDIALSQALSGTKGRGRGEEKQYSLPRDVKAAALR
jgi:hypothetical protein